jgi:hypothetical protein
MNALLAHVTGTGLDDWLIVIVPLSAIGFIIAALARPNGGRSVFARISDRLERITGMAGWAAGTIGVGLGALTIAVIGFYWDVAWHIDLGRDKELFTPAHDMILIGLMLIPFAAGTAIVLATAARAETKLRLGSLRVPWSSLALGAIGLGALTGFPLDEIWHRAYGIDVTMWGPTHLMMIGGASLTPLALWLVLRESGASLDKGTFARRIATVIAGATLTGLSTFQGEFDFGVPQFQLLYHPVLVVAAAAGALTIARIVLGPGGALRATVGFLAIRGGVALLVGGLLGHTSPHFPLYIGAALAVEAVAWLAGTANVKRFALWSGVACASVGLGTEWLWSHAWGRHPWNGDLIPDAPIIALVAGIATAFLGAALGSMVIERREAVAPRQRRIGAPILAVSLVALAVALSLPIKRTTADDITADVAVAAVGTTGFVEVTLTPADAAEGAAWFETMSWQSGRLVLAEMQETGPGRYRSAIPLPISGDAKTLVRLHRGSEVMAVPVYMPADPEIGASEVPAVDRTATFQRDSRLLMRESHAGSPWPARIIFGIQAGIVAVWIGVIGLVAWLVARGATIERTRSGRGLRIAAA